METSAKALAGSKPLNRSSKAGFGMFILPGSSAERTSTEARKPQRSPLRFSSGTFRGLVALLCSALLAPGDLTILAQSAQQPAAAEAPAKIPNDQLDSLVAPIALYPDPLLSQTLVASTYPLEIVQLQQWLEKNKNLKDKALRMQ